MTCQWPWVHGSDPLGWGRRRYSYQWCSLRRLRAVFITNRTLKDIFLPLAQRHNWDITGHKYGLRATCFHLNLTQIKISWIHVTLFKKSEDKVRRRWKDGNFASTGLEQVEGINKGAKHANLCQRHTLQKPAPENWRRFLAPVFHGSCKISGARNQHGRITFYFAIHPTYVK